MSEKYLYLLLSTQRSGSTWLADVTNRAGEQKLSVYGELLLPQTLVWDIGHTDYARYIDSQYAGRRRPWSLYHYLDQLYENAPHSVAFKLMYSDIRRFPELLPYVIRHSRRIRIIHLVRENLLNTVISLERLNQVHIAHLHAGHENPNVQIALDPADTLVSMRRLEHKIAAARTLVRALPNRSVDVSYEGLVRHDQSDIEALSSFLEIDLDLDATGSELKRISSGGQRRAVSNYDELQNALKGSKYACYLECAPQG